MAQTWWLREFVDLDRDGVVLLCFFKLRPPAKALSCDVVSFFPFAYLLFRSQVGHPLTLYLPLSCPQISTAYIMTSQFSALAGGLSLKKAKSNY